VVHSKGNYEASNPFALDTDKKNALETVDYWVDSVAKGRSNVDPETIPWQAIRNLLGQTIYGGRIDNIFDQRLLESFLAQLFRPDSFDLKFPLINAPRADRDNLVVAVRLALFSQSND